jgi:fructan beta-fructosidase
MIKIVITGILSLLLVTAWAQESRPFSKLFTAKNNYFLLPVKNGAPKKRVDIWLDGRIQRYIDIELAETSADWFAYLDISQWKGRELDLRVNLLKPGSSAFVVMLQSDTDTRDSNTYQEKYRGRFHFSPKRGWMNDPNGLVYYNGEYHLFFQHNPYGTEWGNMTWGHAVSKDLIHWQEVGEALHPDECGTMYSGSAIVDVNNTSGLGKDGKAPMLAFYTCDRSWTQGMAWTTDGRTFQKSPHTVVPRYTMGNRDPKVIWHEATKKWVMVFWAEDSADPAQHTIRFYTSPNLKDWTYVSSLKGGHGRDNFLFECPELYELPVEGDPTQKRWIICGASGMYAIGQFDGKVFTPETARLQAQHGRDFYAAQTFNNEPRSRRIEIGWWRTKTNVEGMTFNQSMSIPMEIRLVKTDSGLRMARFPVKELELLRTKTHNIGKKNISDKAPYDLSPLGLLECEMRLELQPGKASAVTFTIHGKNIVYNVAAQTLACDGVTAYAPLKNGKLPLVIYTDRIGFEIFTTDGLLFMPVNANLDMEQPITISSTGGKTVINNLVAYELGSAWK